MGSSSPTAEPAWVTGLQLAGAGEARAELQLALHPGDLERIEQPFLALSDAGRFSRVLLARIALGGATIRRLALKLQKDVYRPAGTGLAAASIDNREIDLMWQRERDNLGAMQGHGAIPALELGLEGTRLPPTTFCRTTGHFFQPLCPERLTPLAVCRDDALLAEYGLEPYSTSLERFLYAPDAFDGVTAKDVPRFYTWSNSAGARAKAGVVIGRREQLYVEAVARFEGGLDPDVQRRLEAEHPGWFAAIREAAVSGIGAELAAHRFSPLSYYGSEVLVTDVQDLRFDELVDLIGGRDFGTVAIERPGAEARSQSFGELAPAFGHPAQWIHHVGRGRQFAHEVLYLKLLAFRQVCVALAEFHARCDRPLLGLSPDNLLVEVPRVGVGLPARWGFSVRLADLGAQHRFTPPGAAEVPVPELLLPSLDLPQPFQSPLTRPSGFGRELTMRLSVPPDVQVEIEGTASAVTLRGQASSGRIGDAQPGDLVRVAAHSPLPGAGDTNLYGVLRDVTSSAASIRVFGNTEQLGVTHQWPSAFEASVAVYRRFHAPCDLFGLGMLLCRAVLVNDEQDIFAVEDVVRRLLDRLNLEIAGIEEPDEAFISRELSKLVQQEPAFQAAQVLHLASDRMREEQPIAPAVWQDVLLLAFRLLCNLEHYGYSVHHADYDHADPGALVRQVVTDVDGVTRRLYVELFGSETRGREVGEICAELIGDINKILVGSEGTGVDLGEATR